MKLPNAGTAPRDSSSSLTPSNYFALFSRNSENRTVRVVAHQQRAISCDRDAGRPAPDTLIVDDESGHEVLVRTGRLAVLHRAADHLVIGRDRRRGRVDDPVRSPRIASRRVPRRRRFRRRAGPASQHQGRPAVDGSPPAVAPLGPLRILAKSLPHICLAVALSRHPECRGGQQLGSGP